jgi:hypothetical protein
MIKETKKLTKAIAKMIGPSKRHSPAGKSYLKSIDNEIDKKKAETHRKKESRKKKNKKIFEAFMAGKYKVKK